MGHLTKIHDVVIKPLKKIEDDRGMLLHMMKRDFDLFEKFGEVYFSFVNPGVVKGWKYHKEMIQNYVVPIGKVKLVLVDLREDSPTLNEVDELELSIEDYFLVKVPCGIWYSFKAISSESAMIANCASVTHSPEESLTLDINTSKIPYQWN